MCIPSRVLGLQTEMPSYWELAEIQQHQGCHAEWLTSTPRPSPGLWGLRPRKLHPEKLVVEGCTLKAEKAKRLHHQGVQLAPAPLSPTAVTRHPVSASLGP